MALMTAAHVYLRFPWQTVYADDRRRWCCYVFLCAETVLPESWEFWSIERGCEPSSVRIGKSWNEITDTTLAHNTRWARLCHSGAGSKLTDLLRLHLYHLHQLVVVFGLRLRWVRLCQEVEGERADASAGSGNFPSLLLFWGGQLVANAPQLLPPGGDPEVPGGARRRPVPKTRRFLWPQLTDAFRLGLGTWRKGWKGIQWYWDEVRRWSQLEQWRENLKGHIFWLSLSFVVKPSEEAQGANSKITAQRAPSLMPLTSPAETDARLGRAKRGTNQLQCALRHKPNLA